jgi:hypothetical protein
MTPSNPHRSHARDIVGAFPSRGANIDLPKNPHSKRGRLILLLLEIWGGLTALAIIALLLFESMALINATLWHMRHGNTVSFDGHLFHLPLSWYPGPVTTPGELNLHHAQFGGVSISNIALAIYPKTLSNQAATDRIAVMTGSLNKSQPNSDRWIAETLRGRKLTFHCTVSTVAGVEESLTCQAADSNLTVIALAVGRTARTQALDILETSE